MKIRHLSIITGVAALSLGSLVAFAEPNAPMGSTANNFDSVLIADRGDGQGLRFGGGRLISELDLTPEQQTQIQAIKENYGEEMKALKEQMKPIKEEMRALMVGSADKNTIRTKHQQAQALHSKIQDTRFEQMLEIREVLTPTQREKFAEIMDQKRERRTDRQNMNGQRPEGGGMRPRLGDR